MIDPIYQSDRPFRKADFRFSIKRLLVAMIAVAVLTSLGTPRIWRFDSAILLIGVVLAILFNDWSTWWLHRGRRARAAGRISEAIADFTRAIDASPDNPFRYYCRGSAQFENGDRSLAREDIARSAQLAPDSAIPIALRGWINVSEGLNEEARNDFLKAIELDPMLASAELGCALVDFRCGNYAEAIRRAEKCRILHPRDVQSSCLLAWFLSTCCDDQYRDGLRAVAIAEAASRTQAERFYWGELALAAAYAETGRFDEAIVRSEYVARLASQLQRSDVARFVESLKSGKALRDGRLASEPDEENRRDA